MADVTTLTEEQRKLGEEFERLARNVQKDGPARKTEEYINQRMEAFNNLLEKFEKNHKEILQQAGSEDHKYMKHNYYEQVHNLYEKMMNHLEKYRKSEDASSKPESTQQGDFTISNINIEDYDKQNPLQKEQNRLNILEKKLQVKFVALQRILGEINFDDTMRSTAYYKYKIDKLEEEWNTAKALKEEIICYTDQNLEDDMTYKELRTRYEDMIIKLYEKKELMTCKEEKLPQEVQGVQLPRIQIPTFEGRYKDWVSFYDIFDKVIHNNQQLGNAEKMHYLKTSLKGEAAKLIQHLSSSVINYEAAWDLVRNRYNNKRILFSTHMDTILNLPPLSHENINGLKQIHDTTKECMYAIKNLMVETESWSPMIAHIIIKKLDSETHKLYEQAIKEPREIQKLEDILNFINARFQALEAVGQTRVNSNQGNKSNGTRRKEWTVKNYHTRTSGCSYCKEQHTIYTCVKFRNLKTHERLQFIKQKSLCTNCLNHGAKENCYSQNRCATCNQQHHTLLHIGSSTRQDNKTKSFSTTVTQTGGEIVKSKKEIFTETLDEVLLATAVIKAKTIYNTYEELRALIDPGSQGTLITENAAQLLGLPRMKTYAEIIGMGDAEAGTSLSKISIQLKPRFPSQFKINLEALILPTLTKAQPEYKIMSKEIITWKNITLADPLYDTPGPIDMIIGADVYSEIITEGIKKTKSGLVAQKTEFGWILSGKATLKQNNVTRKIHGLISRIEVDKQLRKFWEGR